MAMTTDETPQPKAKASDGIHGGPAKRTDIDRSQWMVIPSTDEVTRQEAGLLALYVGPSGERGPNGHYRDGFDWRWSIWFSGTLLGEGFTDNPRSARSAADQEADRCVWRIKEAVRAMDIRNYQPKDT